MAKKKSNYTNNSSRRFYIEAVMENNKDPQVENALRYALENDVSTPEVTIGSHGHAYYNPAIYELLSTYKDSNSSRQKEIDKYPKIPYIKDKEIRLTKGIFNTGKISTNLLDSIYDSAQRVGIPFEEALGLAGRESTLGIGRGFKEGTEVSPTELMSNWQQVQDIINTNSDIKRRNRIMKDYYNNKPISQEDIDFFEKYQKNEQKETDSTRPIKEHPLDNALKLFMSGKYNTGDPNHTNMVKRDGKTLMLEPAVIKWMKENNKHSLGGWFAGLGSKLDGLNANLTDKFFDSKFGQGLSGFGIKAGNIGGMANTATTAIGGLLAGQNKTGVGTALQGIGSLASNIPGVGGLIGAGVNMVGGLVNAAFGSNINKEFVNQTEQAARQQSNYLSKASDNEALLSDWNALSFLQDVSKSDVGSDGWFSNKAGRETDRLNDLVDDANIRALTSINNTAENIDKQKNLLMQSNYTAYGGPINMKYTGVMSPFGNQFDNGGLKDIVNDTWEERKVWGTIFKNLPLLLNYERPKYGGGKSGGGGATSLFEKTPDTYSIIKDTIWVPYRETFNEAFRKADNAGLKEFMFDGMPYTTEKGDNPDNNRAGEERVVEGLLPIERTRRVKNEKAEGGNLFTNGVTTINNGGTHESNPYEGVQMGVDPQGIPNLVEEGEVIYDDYVFSNRLRVPKEVRQKYKLRGITFADAAKQLQKESEERPNDPISKNSLETSMQMLINEQEMIRAKKGNNKYAKGGRLCNKFLLGGEPIIDNPYSVYSSIPKDNFDFSKWFTIDKNNLGKVTGYSDAYRNYKFTADKAREWAALFGNDESLKSYLSKGNKLEDLTDEDVQKGSLDNKHGWLHKARAMMANLDNANTIDVDGIIKGLNNTPFEPLPIKSIPIKIEDGIVDEEPLSSYKGIEPMKNNWLRYAPIVGSGLAVANDLFGGNEPDYSNADMFERAIEGTNRQIGYRPIGNYLQYNPFDRDYYINKLDANTAAGRRAVINNSGGNRAAALAGILATDYNYGNQLGDLIRKAEEYNLEQRQRVEDFNRNTNMFNSEMGTKVDMFNAEQAMQRARMYGSLAEYRDKVLAANRAEKSANLTNFIQGLGDLGREISDRDMLRWLADLGVLKYDSKGKYTGDNKSNKTAKGGRISRKKRGGFTI